MALRKAPRHPIRYLIPFVTPDGLIDYDRPEVRQAIADAKARGDAARARRRRGPASSAAPRPFPPAVTTEEVRAIVADAARREWERRGPLMWAELHEWARTADLSTPEAVATARVWLDAFGGRVGCGECKNHWTRMVAANPPDFTGNAALYAWTVVAHDRVNARLRKPPYWGLAKLNRIPSPPP